jgi:mRNA-degrading endonuclease RelE of RelBE toxin-antitoxin system
MSTEVRVEFTSEFKRNLRALAKRYRSIRLDVEPIIERIQAGELLGDRVPGTHYVVFKVRVQNSDIQKGKSAGYRLIYQAKEPTFVVLVTIYSKVDQSDISPDRIRRILSDETNARA